jgi:hypothetical protein
MARYHHISVAVPLMDEWDNLPTLLEMLRHQTFRRFTLYCCVNQPEPPSSLKKGGFLSSPSCNKPLKNEKSSPDPSENDTLPRTSAVGDKAGHQDFSPEELERIRQANQQTLVSLRQIKDIPIYIIDRSSPGQGWQGKQKGVGWARKLLFDAILQGCGEQSSLKYDPCNKLSSTKDKDTRDNVFGDPDELIISLDADTTFQEDYFQCVLDAMNRRPEAGALCVPYYHPLSGNEDTDRALLRYEIYMRHYLLNMLLIDNPYAFSALGSAMAFPAWAYKRIGGITPLQGGEDFYLMQKFAKTGQVIRRLEQCVYPQGRISHRVPFGTGPAIAKGLEAMAQSYPFFSSEAFRQVDETYRLFPALFSKDVETPMSPFLRNALKTADLWGPLRNNFKEPGLFVHACEERVDGLRILQFLRTTFQGPKLEMPALFSLTARLGIKERKDFDFATAPINELNDLRNQLFTKEMELR